MTTTSKERTPSITHKAENNLGVAIAEKMVDVPTNGKSSVRRNGRSIDRSHGKRQSRSNRYNPNMTNCPVDGRYPMDPRLVVCLDCTPEFETQRTRRVSKIADGTSNTPLTKGAWALSQTSVEVLEKRVKDAKSKYFEVYEEDVFAPMKTAGRAISIEKLENGKPLIEYDIEGSGLDLPTLRDLERIERDKSPRRATAYATVRKIEGQLESVDRLIAQGFEPDSETREQESSYAMLKSQAIALTRESIDGKELSKAQQLEILQKVVEEIVGKKFEDGYLDTKNFRRRKDQIWGMLNKHAQELAKQQLTDSATADVSEMEEPQLDEIIAEKKLPTTAKTLKGKRNAVARHQEKALA